MGAAFRASWTVAAASAALLVGACRQPIEAVGPSARGSQLAEADRDEIGRVGDRVLRVTRRTSVAPEGGDGPERLDLAWRTTDGTLEAITVAAPTTAAATWAGTLVVLDVRNVLSQHLASGQRLQLALEVFGELRTSDDGSLLAYVAVPGVAGDVHVLGPRGDVVVARNLGSAGLFRFSPSGRWLAFVGSRAGGVLGVWITHAQDDQDLRCVTNCTLRAGVDPIADQVDVPGDSRSLRVTEDAVDWSTASGRQIRVAIGDPR